MEHGIGQTLMDRLFWRRDVHGIVLGALSCNGSPRDRHGTGGERFADHLNFRLNGEAFLPDGR